MNKLLSLAIPVRNGEDFVEKCLESAAAANRGRFEIVVSDNCSTDGTRAVLERFKERCPEMRIVAPPEGLGLSDHLNFVASQCTGDWVKFICHDDLLFPEAVDRIQEALESMTTEKCALLGNGEVHLFTSGYRSEPAIPSSASLAATYWKGEEYLAQFLAGGSPVPSLTTACVRRRDFEAAGGFNPKWLHLDTFLWSMMLLDHDIIWIKNSLTVNRIHGGQVAAQVRKVNRSTQEHREFWPMFVKEISKRRPLPWSTRLRLRMKWILVAATDAAIFSRKGRHAQALKIIASTGLMHSPITAAAYLRAIRQEKKRVAPLLQHVSLQEIYPG